MNTINRNLNITFRILIIFSVLLLISCNRNITKFDPNTAKYYPPPPDTTRLQFLTGFTLSTQVAGDRSGFAKFLFGALPPASIIKPYGIATSPGKIYICDTGIRGLEIIDLEKKEFKVFSPGGKGQLILPMNCCLDDQGNLYVADVRRRQVVAYDPEGSYKFAIGDTGSFKPTDVAVWENRLYIVDLKENQVDVYDRDTRSRLFSIPEAGPGQEAWLYSPTNIYADDSAIYVSDMGDAKIKIYTHDGNFVRSVGSYGKSPGQFTRNKGVAVDKERNIYVVDAAFENVQIFNKDGQLLMFFGGPYKSPGDMWLPAKVAIDYDNMKYFEEYADPEYTIDYLVFVTNQYGPDKVNVYGFLKPKPNANQK